MERLTGKKRNKSVKLNSPVGKKIDDSPQSSDINEELDTIHLLTIFPPEVWLLILDNVGEKEATDFCRISNASLYFRSLMHSRTVKVLFPSVIKLVIEKQPKLLPNFVVVLPLRKVCRVWKDGVDNAVQGLEFFYLLERDQREVTEIINPYTSFEPFRSLVQFENFERHFDPTHVTSNNVTRNPFLLRGVRLKMPENGPQFNAFYQKCFAFLQKYGMHVWHCVVVRKLTNKMDHLKFYKLDLKRLLRQMRNLRTLIIHDKAQGCHDFRRRYSEKLTASLTAVPLPQLPQLRRIGFRGPGAPPAPFVRAFVTRNPEVQVFSGMLAGLNGGWSVEHMKMYLAEMPNLTRLSVLLLTESELQAFCTAQEVNCLRLQHLYIYVGDNVKHTEWKTLFRTLEAHFSKSLTQLHLCLPPPTGNRIPKGLLLPKLKQLTLQIHKPMPLDFVLLMKDNLEELCIQYGESTGEDNADELIEADDNAYLKVWQFWGKPGKSNVWSLLPKLKKLIYRRWY